MRYCFKKRQGKRGGEGQGFYGTLGWNNDFLKSVENLLGIK
jgi:hypothetical protein